MKKILSVFLLCSVAFLAFAADRSQVVIINTGKSATLKLKSQSGSDKLRIRELAQKDRKTGEQKFCYIGFGIIAKSSSTEKKIKLNLEASQGDLTIYIGRPKADALTWKSFKVDGKELLTGKNGETFVVKQFKAGKIDKKKEVVIEASYRGATRKEEKNIAKSSKKKSKKASPKKNK